MRKLISSVLFVGLVSVAGACTATGSARYSASASMPSMVYISSGVQVIEDYPEPIFYSSNVYWRFNGGIWYRSRVHTGGWVRATPPTAIVRIERPAMYVRYRANAQGQARAQQVQERNEERREAQQERQEDKREAQQEKREEKQEAQQEKREAQQEKREAQQEKREDKAEKREDKAEKREDKRDDHKGHGKK